jgi:hypothetical protein
MLTLDGVRLLVHERIDERVAEAATERLTTRTIDGERASRRRILPLRVVGRVLVLAGAAIAGDAALAAPNGRPGEARDGAAVLPPASARPGSAGRARGSNPCVDAEVTLRHAA